MAEYTEYLNLKKPAPEDFALIEDVNKNMDKIDDKLKEMEEEMASSSGITLVRWT